jgi:hypothetical protein
VEQKHEADLVSISWISFFGQKDFGQKDFKQKDSGQKNGQKRFWTNWFRTYFWSYVLFLTNFHLRTISVHIWRIDSWSQFPPKRFLTHFNQFCNFDTAVHKNTFPNQSPHE